ncbi:MAG: MerR family transcriptional regulator [Aureispira sp.]|nr:MerR family transcriptional regulator [Aureispira sp.]
MGQEHSSSMTAKIVGVSAATLKSWEKNFDHIKSKKNESGKLFYTDSTVKHLKILFYLIKERGFTIKGAKLELERKGSEAVNKAKLLGKLTELKGFLVDVREQLD